MGHLKAMVMIIYCLAQAIITRQTGQFIGASMSFTIINGTNGFEVKLDVISGWVLGLGPCGINCSRASINSNTKGAREEVLHRQGDSHFFGNWTVEFQVDSMNYGHINQVVYSILRTTQMLNINQVVYSSLNESVVDVSEKACWEQVRTVVRYPMIPNATYMDIAFEGLSWRNLSMQGGYARWHIQMKATPQIRSDTGNPNNSPQTFNKPFYRLHLDKDNYIRVATTDPDGDNILCAISEYIEAGVLSMYILPNITVTKDCIIMIPSHRSLGYHNGSMGAVAITVRDLNVSGETAGGTLEAFSTIGVQFLVQFLDNISEPIFIFPTPEGNHKFNIYLGTTWKIDVYAEPISPALINHFSCLGRQHEDVKIIYVKSTSVLNHVNVKMATMTWTPLHTDVGNHILCVGVEDSYGMDSSDQRCYVLDVQSSLEGNQSMNNPNNKPYFFNIPRTGDLLCDANATCIFPIYATTPLPGAKIISIWLGKYDVDWAKNDTEIVTTGNGIFKMDNSIRHVAGGTTKLCFYAQDSTGAISDEECLHPRIIPPDPCAKIPCRSGICRKLDDDASQFYCECYYNHIYGQYCEHEVDDCPPGRCLHGICHDLAGPQFLCTCTPGWTGRLCDLNINDCINDHCNSHGICIDGVNGFTCDCFDRYDGDNCTIDRCNTSLQTKSCDQSGCHANTCTNNGVCTTGGICHCCLGYEGSSNCDMGKTFHPTQQVTFVEPTFSDGSTITCYNGERCQFSVFVAGGSNPAVGVQYISEDLKNLLNISTPVKAQYIPGIQNMFESLVSIDALPGPHFLGRQYICLEAHERGTDGSGISSRCFNIRYIEDPKFVAKTQEYADKNKTIKFVNPTPKGQSEFICKTNESCHLFVFTNKDNISICHTVVASSKVYIQPVITRTADCFTDVSFKFSDKGPRTLCLKADDTDGEKRCFTIDVMVSSEDPCLSSPCTNKGHCLKKLNSTFECICPTEYMGLICENGPCPATNSPCKHGYCEVNADVRSCFCPLGYKGENCTDAIPDDIKDPLNNSPIFTDTFIPKQVVCVRNRPCVIPFGISGNYLDPYGPTVQFGFVSPTIQTNAISTPIKANSTNGTYTIEITLTPKLPGNQKVCLQTLNKDMVNVDEICFDVDVRPDAFYFYGDTTKPHFTAPSITQNSTVFCTIGVTCHMMFVVSSGKSNANNCPTMILTEGLGKDFHIVSNCKPCTDNTTAAGNCSVDLVFNPSSSYLGQNHRLCLEAQLLWKRVIGEERCFNLEVKGGNVDDLHGPCRTLHCRNRGFCDSGNGQPVCHCHSGYTGSECENSESTSLARNVNMLKPYYIDPTLPDGTTVMCKIASECHIRMFTSEKASNCPTVSEISDYTAGLHIFSPASNPDHDCVIDVSYIPTKEMEGQQRRICFQASLPGLEGEIRCYNVISRAISNPQNATTATTVLQRSDVECQATSFKIFVPKNLVPGHGPVTWRDSSCVVYSNGTHFVDNVGLRDCGTTLTLESDSVVFENDLIFHKNGTEVYNGSNIVTYGSDYEFVIPVKCVYPRNSNISTNYIPIVQQIKILERRNGQLDLTMRQYEAEDYNHAVPFNAYPRQVPLNNDIFIRVAMENNVTGLGLSADNCFATSTPSPVDPNWYQLISSGCPVNNAKIHPSGINDVKFSFHAFNFRHNTSGIVYVHCQVSVCLDTDPACVVGCVTRKKRSASVREGTITSNLISTGPFVLTADEGGVAMSTVVAAVSIAVAVIAAVIAIIGWTRKSKKGADS